MAQGSLGAWIFVSHSHRDWDTVRVVRNVLEDRGHRPLLFFLRCLDDNSALGDFIRREIEARTWFLLCDSANARVSRWVQEEVSIIKAMPNKLYEQVDLMRPLTEQIERIDALCRRATVYLSYARDDSREHARQLYDLLQANDYFVREPDLISSSSRTWQQEIADVVDNALEHGIVLISFTSLTAKVEAWRYPKRFLY